MVVANIHKKIFISFVVEDTKMFFVDIYKFSLVQSQQKAYEVQIMQELFAFNLLIFIVECDYFDKQKLILRNKYCLLS